MYSIHPNNCCIQMKNETHISPHFLIKIYFKCFPKKINNAERERERESYDKTQWDSMRLKTQLLNSQIRIWLFFSLLVVLSKWQWNHFLSIWTNKKASCSKSIVYTYISNLNARLNAKDRHVYKCIQNGYLQHISTELSTHCWCFIYLEWNFDFTSRDNGV